MMPSLPAVVIAAVWIFHGLYSKLLGGIPRHRQIVSRILGEWMAGAVTTAVGVAEVLVGIWVLSGWQRVTCALAQTVALVAMNTLEIWRARDLLISAPGMVALNAGFAAFIWYWALSR